MSVVLAASDTAKAPPPTRSLPAVQALEISKRIDGRPILQDVCIDIAKGRYVALLGANGAGKTTLMKLLSMLAPPSGGQLHLFGQRVTREGSPKLRARIGLIGHQPMLYGDLTARENLLLFGRLYGVSDVADRAEALLKRVDLAGRADDPVKAYSRGMTQRASIARALMHGPDLLLADEPFSGLDAPSNQMLEELLAELHRDGKTIVLAHHDIEQSLRVAEQAVVLRRGRVVVDRPTRQLDRETTLAEMTGQA
ncbi:MAG: Vitamin B12 import ATP-binding protein BtuD [Phycisphaerae bacterium]|nr:Vitamin B12 import ATP-binding protein BtuD [Phycisphaerae bacterium]